jgi:hypothetical protein
MAVCAVAGMIVMLRNFRLGSNAAVITKGTRKKAEMAIDFLMFRLISLTSSSLTSLPKRRFPDPANSLHDPVCRSNFVHTMACLGLRYF